MKDDTKGFKQKMNFIYFLVLLAGVCITGRICYLQFVEGDLWKEKAEAKILQIRTYQARRGNICAMDSESGEMHFLATNIPIYDVYFDFGGSEEKYDPKTKTKGRVKLVPQSEFNGSIRPLCDSLARLFAGMRKAKNAQQYESLLRKAYKKNARYIEIQRGISTEQLNRMKSFPLIGKTTVYKRGGKPVAVKSINAAIVNLTSRSVRIYPYGNLARRTIGISVNNSDTTFNGIDGYYSPFLTGEHGMRMERKINPGIWIPVETESSFLTAKDGYDAITTLDIKLQELAENSLRQCLDSNHASSGCVILMEVKTGYIKAISNLTKRSSGEYAEIENIAISDLLEPGSTFKMVTAMMMLDKGYADTADLVPTGTRMYQGATKPIRDVGEKNVGEISFCKAIERSSNVGISYLVYNKYKNNRRQLAKDLKSYFSYEKLNLDIKVHEPKPAINDSTVYMDDILRLSFGYVTMMTPLQMLTFYNGIANDGRVMKPLFVKEIRQADKVIETFAPVVLKENLCQNSKTLPQIRDILSRVVKYGTGRKLAGTCYGIAGKSGTAEIGYNDQSKQLQHRASFVGYFPADKPQYSCIVVISEPQKALTHGGDLAAPVFKNLSDRVVGTLLNAEVKMQTPEKELITPNWAGNTQEIETIFKQLQLPAISLSETTTWAFSQNNSEGKQKIYPLTINPLVVPSVKGMTIKDATYLLGNLGLKVSFSGKGKVRQQSLTPLSSFRKGDKIFLTLEPNNP